MMNASQVRLYQNPVLTGILQGFAQGRLVGERLFPRLPHALAGVTLPKLGDARRRWYNLRRAPGGPTKSVAIDFEGKVFTVDQYAVEIPVPRELIREFDAATRVLNIDRHLELGRVAMETADAILALDYELECAELAGSEDSYAIGHTSTLAGATKWSHPSGTPVAQIRDAAELIRRKTGKRPNRLILSADAAAALAGNFEVSTWLPGSYTGMAPLESLKAILSLEEIEIGESIWIDDADAVQDVWSNMAVLAYVPDLEKVEEATDLLAEPAFGFTGVLEGHPFAEQPYYEPSGKRWVFGATFERQPNVVTNTAAFLFKEPA